MNALPAWQQAELEYDIAREQLRAERHARLADRRATHLWPIAWPLTLTGALTLAAAIEGGAAWAL